MGKSRPARNTKDGVKRMVDSQIFKKIKEDELEKERILSEARIKAEEEWKKKEAIRVPQEIIPAIKERIQRKLDDIAKNPHDKYHTTTKRTVNIEYDYYNSDYKYVIEKEICDYIIGLGFRKPEVNMYYYYYYADRDREYYYNSSGIRIRFDPWNVN